MHPLPLFWPQQLFFPSSRIVLLHGCILNFTPPPCAELVRVFDSSPTQAVPVVAKSRLYTTCGHLLLLNAAALWGQLLPRFTFSLRV
mmetsp:Transcript_64463/g.135263  ORF Transcript_64463/g.135263 Transcript_64463/m.135263 type:complete len:87 (+) Transcript_64463:3035-3295(+)